MLLKLVTDADRYLSEGEKIKRKAQIDLTLKMLDARYDDEKNLDPIESSVTDLEHKIRERA